MIAWLVEWLLIGSVRLLVGAHPRWQGSVASRGQRIYIANHSSHLDALLLLSTLPKFIRRQTRPVAAADYWNSGALRRYLIHSIFRGVLVERERAGLNPLEPLCRALRAGDSLILFPEGTRGTGGGLQPLKPGLFHLARAFPQVEIVPAWIDNSYRVLPKGLAIPVPLLCSITFGAPLHWTEGQLQVEFMSKVRNALEGARP
jgi:1-acyl-sn-glycerol-3-phosphate acyltransferase